MKFEKFLKNVGTRGTIVNCGSCGQWLKLANVMLKIPTGVNVIAPLERMVFDYEAAVINRYNDGYCIEANLVKAELINPSDSPSMLRRVFADDDGGRIDIDNKTFGIIERYDRVFTDAEENNDEWNVVSLVVTEGFGDDEHIVGIIFDEQYYHNKLIEKENKTNGN